MKILLEFVSWGTIGASLSFLLLSFRLLANELRRPTFRSRAVLSIFLFSIFSLVFFVVGVISQLVVTNGNRVMDSILPKYVLDRLQGISIGRYGYDLLYNQAYISYYKYSVRDMHLITPEDYSAFAIVVADRAKTSGSKLDGSYPHFIANLPLESPDEMKWQPSDQRLYADGCVQFVVFGVPVERLKKSPLDGKTVFTPKDYPGTVVYDARTGSRDAC